MFKQIKDQIINLADTFFVEIKQDMFPEVLSHDAEVILNSMTREQKDHMWLLAKFPETDVRSGGPLYVESHGKIYRVEHLKDN